MDIGHCIDPLKMARGFTADIATHRTAVGGARRPCECRLYNFAVFSRPL